MLLCGGEQPLLPQPALFTGTRSLLTNVALEDVISHAPKAVNWVSNNACLLTPVCQCHAAELSIIIERISAGESICQIAYCFCVL